MALIFNDQGVDFSQAGANFANSYRSAKIKKEKDLADFITKNATSSQQDINTREFLVPKTIISNPQTESPKQIVEKRNFFKRMLDIIKRNGGSPAKSAQLVNPNTTLRDVIQNPDINPLDRMSQEMGLV